jgi:hypothetical protein
VTVAPVAERCAPLKLIVNSRAFAVQHAQSLLQQHTAIVNHIIMHCTTSGRHSCLSHAYVTRARLQRPRLLRVAPASGTSEAQAVTDEPTVRLTIKPSDGSADISVDCPSGEQLRYCLLDNKVDLYTTW